MRLRRFALQEAERVSVALATRTAAAESVSRPGSFAISNPHSRIFLFRCDGLWHRRGLHFLVRDPHADHGDWRSDSNVHQRAHGGGATPTFTRRPTPVFTPTNRPTNLPTGAATATAMSQTPASSFTETPLQCAEIVDNVCIQKQKNSGCDVGGAGGASFLWLLPAAYLWLRRRPKGFEEKPSAAISWILRRPREQRQRRRSR